MKTAGGKLYVIAGGHAWVFTPNQNGNPDFWTEITPPGEGYLSHLAVSPSNPQHIVVTNSGMTAYHLWRSNDGGTTWDNMPRTIDGGSAVWRTNYAGNDYLSVGQILFNPQDDTDVWFAEGFGAFETRDLVNQPAGQNVTWSNRSDGIEETVAQDVVASGGNVVVATWDLQGFHYYSDSISVPDRQIGAFPNNFALGQSLSMAGNVQNFIAFSSADQRTSDLASNYSGVSDNGGVDGSWSLFNSIQYNQLPDGAYAYNNNPLGLRHGVIAVAANNTANLVWFPSVGGQTNDSQDPYFSFDGGNSWNPSQGLPGNDGLSIYFFSDKRVLCADGSSDNTFYAYPPNAASVYVSYDGGGNFQVASNTVNLPGSGATLDPQLRSEPGVPGNIWWAGGYSAFNSPDAIGLHHSTDGGASFTLLNNVTSCWQIGFGAPYPGSSHPTVFIYGRVNGQLGVYASTDEGANWQFLGDYPLGIFDRVHCISGDMNKLGRVYVGFQGNGFAYRDSTLAGPGSSN